MNDPGLDEPISNDAKDVENQKNDERDEMEEDEQAFLEPRCAYFLPLHFRSSKAAFYTFPQHAQRIAMETDISIPGVGKLSTNNSQSLVVRKHSVPTHSRDVRSHGLGVLDMCFGGTLESLHTPGSSRAKRGSTTGSEMVRIRILQSP